MMEYKDFAARRSVRHYSERIVPKDVIDELLKCGVTAASGSNQQPWGFVLIQDKKEIARLNTETKEYLRHNLDRMPFLAKYARLFSSPEAELYHRAANLLIIYGNTESHWYVYDCSMVAGNIMLAASAMGLGTCWIGFALHNLNTPEFKASYRVPGSYELVCAMTIGYPRDEAKTEKTRKAPVFFNL